MAKAKLLRKAADAAGLLKKADRVVGDAPPPVRGLDDLAQYSRTADELEANKVLPTPESVNAEIDRVAIAEEEATRMAALDPDAKFESYVHQAGSEEEFATRVPQFRKKGYVDGVQNVEDASLKIPTPTDTKTTLDERYGRWKTDSDPVHKVARTNLELQSWAKDGAYKRKDFFGPDVDDPEGPLTFFRMDVRQDPRAELSPIQFDVNANEFGMHIGSRQAGKDIISPEVGVEMARRFKAVKATVDDLFDAPVLKEAGVDPLELFEEAFTEMRTNMFLRHGEEFKDMPSVDTFKLVLEDFFEELSTSAAKRGLPELAGSPNAEALSRRMLSIMRYHYDPLQHPVLTNAKQGLLVKDLGPGNTAAGVAEDLFVRGSVFEDAKLQQVMNAENADGNALLREMLREKGYDHLVYVNGGEDKGAISIVLFDEANYQNVYEPTIGKLGSGGGSQAAMASILAPLSAALGLDDDG